MKISQAKVKKMILYFATYTDPNLMGKTKLMKLFYFADFRHVKKYLTPITSDNYVNLEHGPVPSAIMNLVNSVETDIDNSVLGDTISVVEREDSKMKKILVKRKFTPKDAEYFTKSELKVMEEVCEIFRDSTGKQIEEASHNESAWLKTKLGEFIPYELGADDKDSFVEKEDIEAALKIAV
ncbi:MAG: Panacea domain-containing protein [Minisyncoccia bacterium]